ncbi:hypothetical protein PMI09_03676 [Rhizobium sp. CF122]|nr:hypothetical protein PMI09_03676 [Rhizobium sp. CF122]
MSIEGRRAIIARAFNRAKEVGLPLEGSAEFESWLEEWAKGDIDIPILRRRYVELLRARDIAWRNRHVLVE